MKQLRRITGLFLVLSMLFAMATTAENKEEYEAFDTQSEGKVYFTLEFADSALHEGTLRAVLTATSEESTKTNVTVFIAHYDNTNTLKELYSQKEVIPPAAVTNFEVQTEIESVEDGDYARLYIWDAENATCPIGGVYRISAMNAVICDDFEEYESGSVLSAEPFMGVEGGWRSTKVTEANSTDYTYTLGSELFAHITKTENGKALELYDNVVREENAQNGSGSVMAYRNLPLSDTPYEIKFCMTMDTSLGDLMYSGFTLSNGVANTTNNKSQPCALQVRANVRDNGMKVQFMVYDSVLYHDGGWDNLFEGTPLFKTSSALSVTLLVNPITKKITTTISDGSKSASATKYYAVMDNEHITNQSWMGKDIDTIAFNTGFGTKGKLRVDDFRVLKSDIAMPDEEGKVEIRQTFNNPTLFGAKLSSETAVEDWYVRPIVEKNQAAYTPSLGDSLYGEINTVYNKGENGALYLYDAVGRESDAEAGAGGMLLYRSFDAPQNDYRVKFKMFAPMSLGSQQYAGIALGSGVNEGGEDTVHPLALQMVFTPQSNNTKMQFNRYDSIYYKDSSANAFLASGASTLGQNVPWYFDIKVMPSRKRIEVTVTDGAVTSSAAAAYSTKCSESGISEDWSEKCIDTILFNTSAGNNGIITIDDFKIINLLSNSESQNSARNVVCRLEPSNVNRPNFYIYHCKRDGSSKDSVRLAAAGNHYYYDDSRFIERPGLADAQGGVSFESLTYPGCYLKCGDSDDNVYLVADKGTEDYYKRATWRKVSGLDNEAYVSYQSYENTAKYMIYNPSKSLSGAPIVQCLKVTNDDEKSRATWRFRSEGTPTMGDNFNGTSLSGNWGKNYKWGDSHNHYGLARKNQVEVRDGKLILHVEKIAADAWPTNRSGKKGFDNNIGPDAASKGWKKWQGYMGAVYSYKVYNPPVSISGRFKTPATRGWWTAFWLNGNNSWPPEIDIFEYRSAKQRYSMYMNVHQSTSRSSGGSINTGDLWGATHTYSLDWTKTYLNYYIDGRLKKTVTDSAILAKQRNMYIIINHGIGGWEYIPDSSTDWSQTYDCEFFKSYQY